MKIFNLIILTALILFTTQLQAQDGSPSPYSFFGLGDTSFKGTTENISMGGISIYADSIHYNINNPASLTQLKFVNLNLGMANNFIYTGDQNQSQWFSAHNMSYFSLAFPIGKKIGIGMGLIPVNSSGFQIYEKTDLGTYTFKGEGGNSRMFLAGAYKLTKELSIGAEYQYYFGYLYHENYWIPEDIYTYTQQNNNLDFSGKSLKLSTFYQHNLKKDKYYNISANYQIGTDLSASYQSFIQLVTVSMGKETVETLVKDTQNSKIYFPSKLDIAAGYGQKNKWFLGAQYTFKDMSQFRNPYFDPAYVTYKDASEVHLGGFYIPKYNSITKYWERITYRAGAYYKNTGMTIYNEDISDFGITFGLGLPAIRKISNLNIGVELGQRGKITDHLVQEKYINLHIGISLNDKWFIKRKIN